MSKKAINIIGWALTLPIAALFLFSAFNKITGSAEAANGAAMIGLTLQNLKVLGTIEITSLILFIIPRMGVLGTLLLTAYLGGAIATHLEHGSSIATPALVEAALWVVAILRFPELRERLFKGSPASISEPKMDISRALEQ